MGKVNKNPSALPQEIFGPSFLSLLHHLRSSRSILHYLPHAQNNNHRKESSATATTTELPTLYILSSSDSLQCIVIARTKRASPTANGKLATSHFSRTTNISTRKITETSSLQVIFIHEPLATQSSYFRLAPVVLLSQLLPPSTPGPRRTSVRLGEWLPTETSTWTTFTLSPAQSCRQTAPTPTSSSATQARR